MWQIHGHACGMCRITLDSLRGVCIIFLFSGPCCQTEKLSEHKEELLNKLSCPMLPCIREIRARHEEDRAHNVGPSKLKLGIYCLSSTCKGPVGICDH